MSSFNASRRDTSPRREKSTRKHKIEDYDHTHTSHHENFANTNTNRSTASARTEVETFQPALFFAANFDDNRTVPQQERDEEKQKRARLSRLDDKLKIRRISHSNIWSLVDDNPPPSDEGETSSYYYDPESDFDLAPHLRIFCKCCAPCCCCLYSSKGGMGYNPLEDDQSYYSGEDYSHEKGAVSVKTTANSVKTSSPNLYVNKNVCLLLTFTFLHECAESLWIRGVSGGSVFGSYVYNLFQSQNRYVGYFEAIRSGSRLVFVLAWYMIRKNKNSDRVEYSCLFLKVGGALIVLTAGGTIGLLGWVDQKGDDETISNEEEKLILEFGFFAFIMVLWGMLSAILPKISLFLFMECTLPEENSQLLAIRSIFQRMGNFFGLALSVALFAFWGNAFDNDILRKVWEFGMGLYFPAAFSLFFLQKRWIVSKKNKKKEEKKNECGGRGEKRKEKRKQNIPDNGTNDGSTWTAILPSLFLLSNTIIIFGNGMTIKYFSLFFQNNTNLLPVSIQTIYISIPILFTFFSICISAGFLTKRPCTKQFILILSKSVGVLSLYIISIISGDDSNNTLEGALIASFIVRMLFLNLDFLDEDTVWERLSLFFQNRGMDQGESEKKVKTWREFVESSSLLGYTGGVLLGGILIDLYDYDRAFFVAAIIESIGILLYALCISLLPYEQNQCHLDLHDDQDSIPGFLAGDIGTSPPKLILQLEEDKFTSKSLFDDNSSNDLRLSLLLDYD